MNRFFQAARSHARDYRNEANFIAMIYLIGSPVGRLPDRLNPHEVEKNRKMTSRIRQLLLVAAKAGIVYR